MCNHPAQSSVGRGNHPNGRAVTGVAGQAGRVTDATDVRALLADVAGIGPFFAVDTGRMAPGEGWVPVRALADPGDLLADRIAAVGTALGTDGRVAASIAFHPAASTTAGCRVRTNLSSADGRSLGSGSRPAL